MAIMIGQMEFPFEKPLGKESVENKSKVWHHTFTFLVNCI